MPSRLARQDSNKAGQTKGISNSRSPFKNLGKRKLSHSPQNNASDVSLSLENFRQFKADSKVKEGLNFLKKFYDERATIHNERMETRNGSIKTTIEFMGATAPKKSILDRNKVIADKIVGPKEYQRRKHSPQQQQKASDILGIDGLDPPDGKVFDKKVKVYVLKQAEQAWAETTKVEAQ